MWSGQFRITSDGYDLDKDPKELGNDNSLYSGSNDTQAALWTGQTQPTADDCAPAVAKQPLSDNEQRRIASRVGSAVCILTAEHLAFVRVIGEPQGEGLPAEYVIWQRR